MIGGAAREFRGDHKVVPVRRDDVANRRLGDSVLVVVGSVDEVAARVGESLDDPLRLFRRGALTLCLTKHASPVRELGEFQTSSFSKNLVAHEALPIRYP